MHTLLLILAARLSPEEVTRAIRENWSSRPQSLWLLILFALGLAAVIGLLHIRKRRERRGDGETGDGDAFRIFSEVAASLRVAPRDRRMLTRISRQQSLPSPLTLLLSPRTMHHHARSFSGTMSRRHRLRVLRRVSQLRLVLRGR